MALALDNKLQEWRARVQSSTVNAYWRWWLGELKSLLPDSWREKLQHAMRRVTLEVDADEIVLGVEENRRIEQQQAFPLSRDADLQKQQVRELLADNELLESPKVLMLQSSGVLRKEVRLPLAAESNLWQVLRFEMDRQTPFRADDVYFDWSVIGHDKEAGQVRVDLVVVPRTVIDGTCQMLATRGLGVSCVDVQHEGRPLGLNLLPPDKRIKVINRRARLNQALAVGAVILLALAMALSLYLRSHQVAELEEAIADVREEAIRVQRIRDQINDTMESAGFLAERRQLMPMAVDVLADVTRTLPDDTHLDRLVVGQNSVQMQGKSQNAQQLIEKVNESPLMEAAAFRGSTRLDPRSGLEVFEINANLLPQAQPEPSDGEGEG